jgi:hypothetical protein
MFCPKCGNDASEADFCPKCGNALAGAKKTVGKKSSRWLLYLLMGALVLVAMVYLSGHSRLDEQSQPSGTESAAQPTPHSQSVVDTAFTVDANGYLYYKFQVPAGANTAALKGRFTAQGGSGNDIAVFLVDEDAFVNMKNGHDAQVLYRSGKVTQGSIGLELPSAAATYYLVFDNRFSIMAPKAIRADATLSYVLIRKLN